MAGSIQRITVIGAGAWGTALATVAQRAGRDVTLHTHEPETAHAINTDHENSVFLPGIPLDHEIRATPDLCAAAAKADAILMVTPAQFLGSTLRQLAAENLASVPIVICAKGIELETGLLMNEVAEAAAPDAALAVLSGPSPARIPAWLQHWPMRWARRLFAPTPPVMWSGPKSAVPSRT
jgi:glycerol-3-phosphate dehydrogenase (NAD(P)+)